MAPNCAAQGTGRRGEHAGVSTAAIVAGGAKTHLHLHGEQMSRVC